VVGNNGGGVCLTDGKFLLQDSTVSDNHGTGIKSYSTLSTVYKRMVVSNNSEGGIISGVFDGDVGSQISVENSQVIGNAGGGVAANNTFGDAAITVSDSLIARNTAQRCAGANEVLFITGSRITENKAVGDGRGVCKAVATPTFNGATTTITNSTISRNHAGGFGGGLFGGGTITGSHFENNRAGIDGGAIWNVFGVHLQGTTFSGNNPNNCVNAPTLPATAPHC